MLEVVDIHTYYEESHVLRGVSVDCVVRFHLVVLPFDPCALEALGSRQERRLRRHPLRFRFSHVVGVQSRDDDQGVQGRD